MKHLIFSTLFMLTGLALFAQTGNLKGRVVDSNNLSLPGASIYTNDMQIGSITDVNGNYVITGLSAGEYTLKVSYIGFQPKEFKVTITAGKTTIQNLNLEPGIGIEEVTVTGGLQGQAKALNQQKAKANISNIIASDQVGKFPDANIGDALKRIPGINVQYDQGEARFGNIRGIAPQYNSVTINGERIPSAEAEVREIQLDLIPSDMVQMIEVNKAITPDMDADAIGGSINLVTISEPAGQRISGSLSTGYNFLAEEPNYTANIIYGNRFANNKLGLALSASINNNKLGSDNVEAEWDLEDDEIYLKEFEIRQYYLQRIRQSYSASLDFKINENHTLYLKSIYNRRKDWENRYKNKFKSAGPPEEGVYKGKVYDGPGDDGIPDTDDDEFKKTKITRETKGGANDKYGRLEDQQMMQFALSGDHIFGKVKTDWGLSYSKASEDRPQERYIEMEIKKEDINFDISDPKKPLMWLDNTVNDLNEEWSLGDLTEENQYTEDIDVVARLNFEIPLAQGDFKNSIKFGGKYKSKEKKRDNDFFEMDFVGADDDAKDEAEENFVNGALGFTKDMSKNDFMPGDKYNAGSFVTKEFLGELNFNDANSFEPKADYSEYAGNFDASEKVTAGYLMLNQNLGSKLSAIAGVRIEHTSTKGKGFNFDDELDEEDALQPTAELSNDYTNILPNVHLRYNLNKNNVLRFAYTSTIARPGYFDLIPYVQIEDGEDMSIGNPNLEPTTSSNIDIMAEHYFKTIGIVSTGFFYKDIKDFIVDEVKDVEIDGNEYEQTQAINGGDATLWGFEIAAQRRLDFLPGFFSGLGIYANYTYTNSEVKNFNIEDRENETLDMPGAPKHTLNTSLSYETKKFSGRLSFNYASDFIDEFGEDAALDRYYDEVTYLDLNLTYGINKNYLVFADFNNLLNQPLRYFQGESNRTMQMEYYGMTAKAGIKVNF